MKRKVLIGAISLRPVDDKSKVVYIPGEAPTDFTMVGTAQYLKLRGIHPDIAFPICTKEIWDPADEEKAEKSKKIKEALEIGLKKEGISKIQYQNIGENSNQPDAGTDHVGDL